MYNSTSVHRNKEILIINSVACIRKSNISRLSFYRRSDVRTADFILRKFSRSQVRVVYYIELRSCFVTLFDSVGLNFYT